MRKFKVTKKWPGGPEIGSILKENAYGMLDSLRCDTNAVPPMNFESIADFDGFVEEIKEENRFEKAKKFPICQWMINGLGLPEKLIDINSHACPKGDWYASEAQAEARAQLNEDIQRFGVIDEGDQCYVRLSLGREAWAKDKRNMGALNYDFLLPIWATEEDRANRTKLINAFYNTNFK